MDIKTLLTTPTLETAIETAFGDAPFDIYSYKGMYLSSKNGHAQDIRQKMCLLYETGAYTQKDIALMFNSSERVVRKWISRYRKFDSEGLKDLSREPHTKHIKKDDQLAYFVSKIMKEFPFYGCRRIARELEKIYFIHVGREIVRQVMLDLKPQKATIVPIEIEIPKPDMIWHMDMTRMRIYKGRKQYIFGVVDACTRQVHYIMNYSRMSSKQAIDCLEWALKKADTTPKELWVDNGRMFTSKAFKDYVAKRGIKIHYTDKGSPWQNGKIEAHFKILKGEWIKFRRYRTVESLNNSLKEYRRWFNCEREFQKLGYKTPNDIERKFTV